MTPREAAAHGYASPPPGMSRALAAGIALTGVYVVSWTAGRVLRLVVGEPTGRVIGRVAREVWLPPSRATRP